MANVSTPREWEEQFTVRPDVDAQTGYTMIVCTHSIHGIVVFYVASDKFQDNIRALLTPYWINSYTILMQPMEG